MTDIYRHSLADRSMSNPFDDTYDLEEHVCVCGGRIRTSLKNRFFLKPYPKDAIYSIICMKCGVNCVIQDRDFVPEFVVKRGESLMDI